MAEDQYSYIIQKMFIAGNEFDLSYLREATFCETADLSGPFLQFKFYDPFSVIRNRLEIKEGQYVKIQVESVFGAGAADLENKTDTVSLTEQFSEKKAGTDKIDLDTLDGGSDTDELEFRIMSMAVQKDVVTANCIDKILAIMKLPAGNQEGAVRPAFVKNIKELVEYITGDNKGVPDSFPEIDPFHIRAGDRPSVILRRAAREKGALCFMLRGKCVFAPLESLYAGGMRTRCELDGKKYPPDNTPAMITQYLHGPIASHHPIIWYRNLNTEQKMQDRAVRNYESFDPFKGRVRSTEKTDQPPYLVAVTDEQSLNALSAYNVPIIDFQTYGNTKEFVPGFFTLNLFWIIHDPDFPLDESLPNRCRVWAVYHHYRPSKYFCRVIGVRPPGEDTKFTYEQ